MSRALISIVAFAFAIIGLAFSARISAGAGQQPAVDAADLVLTNGKVVTVEEGAPNAQAVAVRGSRIVAVGSSAEIKKLVGPKTQVIDVQGQLVIPGFIEGHGHFTGIGAAELGLKLMNAKTWNRIVAMVAERVKTAKPGEWIYGRGWHQEKWDTKPTPDVEGFPVHDALSKVSPNNPVVLTHASGHATFVNAKAMELSGITSATKDPEGGDLIRDAKGNPTGLLRERASGLVRRGVGAPEPTAAEAGDRAQKILDLATQEVLSKGVTSFQDAGSSFADVDRLKAMADAGKLGVRLWVMLRQPNDALRQNLAKYRMVDYGDGFLTVRGIKHSIDGALGPRGAWLLEPYSDKPSDSGDNTTNVETIRETAKLALEHNYQLCVHAIGDRANRETLDIFEEAFKGRNRRRPPLAGRARAASQPRRHPAIRQARCDRVDARSPLHLGRPLRPRPPRQEARGRRGLRVAEADEIGGARHQRHRRTRGGRRSDRELLRDGDAEAEERINLLPGPADEPDGGAALLHDQHRTRGVRGGFEGDDQAREVRRLRRPVEGHSHHPRRPDPHRTGDVHHRRRESQVQEVITPNH